MPAKEYVWWYKEILLVCPACRKTQRIQEKCYGEKEDYEKIEEEYCGCLDQEDSYQY